jgi:hypothetical protein
MQLESGRSVRVRLPDVASRRDLAALGHVAEQNARRHSKVLKGHARAIDDLRARELELERRLRAVQAQADLALLAALRGSSSLVKKLSETIRRLDAQEHASRSIGKRVRFQRELARGQTVRAAVSSMQTAAYGERGNVFAPNNLLLGASELLWGSVDALLRRLGLWSRPHPVPLTWVGPVVGLAVGHVTVGRQQFDRFVTGQLELRPLGDGDDAGRFAFTGTVDLRSRVAPGYWDEFKKKPSVPATAQITDAGALGIAVAWVELGTLEVLAMSVSEDRSLTVTWTVDMGVGGG